MTEEDAGKRAKFQFYIPYNDKSTYVAMRITYEDVSLGIRMEDSDKGVSDLLDLLRYVPDMAKSCRAERAIAREMSGVDKEISELLEDE